MEGWYHVNLRCFPMSLWILVVILLMVLHYSESACTVQHCNPSFYCNENRCYGCNDGYYLQFASSCIHCELSIPGCATCSSSTSCTKCNDGYYLQSGSCVPCPYRCSTCTNSTQCTTCKDTYWNSFSSCSSTCSTNCTNNVCDDTTGYCYVCKPGTYGPTCGQDCNLCKDGQCDLRKCTNGCKDGYFQEDTASGYSYCYKCVYDNCLTCSNGTYCTQCEQGNFRYYYRQNNGRGTILCLQCFDTCMDCTSTEHCHEDCIHHCSEPVKPGTTKSINNTIQNQLTFGHGLATGIGITIVLVGSGVGIALFIRRQTKHHKHADENSEEHHVYVNTNMTGILSVISSESNEVADAIHTVSSDLTNTGVTNIDSSRDYVMLGDRPTHESDYIDLQNT